MTVDPSVAATPSGPSVSGFAGGKNKPSKTGGITPAMREHMRNQQMTEAHFNPKSGPATPNNAFWGQRPYGKDAVKGKIKSSR